MNYPPPPEVYARQQPGGDSAEYAYRAPLAVVPLAPPIKPTTLILQLVFGTIMALGALIGIAAIILSIINNEREPPGFAFGFIGIAAIAYYITGILGVIWVHKAWSWLPIEHRYAKHWTGAISPAVACGFLFIPYFHYFWMFVIPLGMCEAIERLQVSHGRPSPTPRGLAIAAAISQFFILPAPFLWFAFGRRIEQHMRELTNEAK